MINKKHAALTYIELKTKIIHAGFADEIDWADQVERPDNPITLASETIWVICNSGMKYEIARKIFKKVMKAIADHKDIATVFKNKNKCRAIKAAWMFRNTRFTVFNELEDPHEILMYFESLDGLGPVTKYHLARNVGIDVCKPDRHLVRIALQYGTDPHTLCSHIADRTGDRIGVVDLVLWRSAVLGMI